MTFSRGTSASEPVLFAYMRQGLSRLVVVVSQELVRIDVDTPSDWLRGRLDKTSFVFSLADADCEIYCTKKGVTRHEKQWNKIGETCHRSDKRTMGRVT